MPSAKDCIKFKKNHSINTFHNILHNDIKRLNKKYVAHFLQYGNIGFFTSNAFDCYAFYCNWMMCILSVKVFKQLKLSCLSHIFHNVSTSFVRLFSYTWLHGPIYTLILCTFKLVLLINLCLYSLLCHYQKFLFDRKHRWVQEKLVLLFHFPDQFFLSHANPLTSVMTS